MPFYIFRNKETGEEHEELMSISALDEYLKTNPHLQTVIQAPSLLDPHRMGRIKPDEGFRDILRDIKKGSGKGNNVNTF